MPGRYCLLRSLARSNVQREFHSSPAVSVLHHEWIHHGGNNDETTSSPPNLFLHGLLGNGKNLKTLAKRVVTETNNNDANSGLLLDLRGHGQSLHVTEGPHTFDSCVQDVHTTLDQHSEPSLVMGHSWGGRVALQYVHSLLENTDADSIPTLWLLDTVPGQAHDSVEKVLDAVQRIQLENYKNRRQVAQSLIEAGLDTAIAQWLASSLQQDKETKLLSWGFDANVARELLPEFQRQDFVGLLEDIVKEGGNVHLVKGGLNTAWDESPRVVSQLQELEEKYPWQFEQHTLPNAAHWVHVDDLPGLLDIVKEKS